jgi:hypothetical protein
MNDTPETRFSAWLTFVGGTFYEGIIKSFYSYFEWDTGSKSDRERYETLCHAWFVKDTIDGNSDKMFVIAMFLTVEEKKGVYR